MKYAIFFFGLFLIVPFATIIATYSRRIREAVFAALIVSTAFSERFDINFVSREWYHAPTRGFEVSFVDFLALILFFSTLLSMSKDRIRPYWPASLGLMLVFFVYSCLNVALFDPKIFGLFEIFKQFRGIYVFLAVAFFVRNHRDVYLFVLAVSSVLIYEGLLALYQRYTATYYRVPGTFPHPNILGNYCVLLAPILLSIAISDASLHLRIITSFAWAMACVATVLTISRMSTLAFAVASAGVLLSSFSFQITPKKMVAIVLLGMAGLGMLYRGLDGLQERHDAMAGETDDLMADRHGQYTLARILAKDHPLGIGLNNWSYIVSEQYAFEYKLYGGGVEIQPYFSTSERGETGGRAIMGHTTIGLNLAELGWPGLVLFLALWIYWAFITGQFIFKQASDPYSNLMIGAFFGLIAAFLMLLIEHVFRSQHFFIIFNCYLGVVMAIYKAKMQTNAVDYV